MVRKVLAVAVLVALVLFAARNPVTAAAAVKSAAGKLGSAAGQFFDHLTH